MVAEPIESITRLQKMLFLMQQQILFVNKWYAYETGKLGPYSSELRNDLAELESANIVSAKRMSWLWDDGDSVPEEPPFDVPVWKTLRTNSYRYLLASSVGHLAGSDLWTSLPASHRKEISKFKKFFNSLPLRALLLYIYENYPQFSERVTLRDYVENHTEKQERIQ